MLRAKPPHLSVRTNMIVKIVANIFIVIAVLNAWQTCVDWRELKRHRNGFIANVDEAHSKYGFETEVTIDDGGVERSLRASRDGSLIRALGGFALGFLLLHAARDSRLGSKK